MTEEQKEHITKVTLGVATEIYLRTLDSLMGEGTVAPNEECDNLLDVRAELFLTRVNACSVKGALK